MHDALHRATQRILRLVFWDEVRLFEIFSALNLAAWALILHRAPGLFAAAGYDGFGDIEPSAWSAIFALGAIAQVAGMVWPRDSWRRHIRFFAMAYAAGLWAVVAWNFWRGDISTARLNYSLIALCSALCGGFLGWKTSK